jgi:uncharacterized membrane protein
MSLDMNTSKTVGGIGALLLFIGVLTLFSGVPYLFIIMMGLGTTLVLAGLYGLSGHYHESGIFKKSLIGVVTGIIGIALVIIIFFAFIVPSSITAVQSMFPGWDGDINTLPNITPDIDNMDLSMLYPLLTSLLVMFVVMGIFATVTTFFIRQSLKQLREKSDVGLFETTGTLMLISGFLTFILIGYILLWISFLLLTIAFFQIKPQEPTPIQYDTYQSPPPQPLQ